RAVRGDTLCWHRAVGYHHDRRRQRRPYDRGGDRLLHPRPPRDAHRPGDCAEELTTASAKKSLQHEEDEGPLRLAREAHQVFGGKTSLRRLNVLHGLDHSSEPSW